jgi:hypothetical protein
MYSSGCPSPSEHEGSQTIGATVGIPAAVIGMRPVRDVESMARRTPGGCICRREECLTELARLCDGQVMPLVLVLVTVPVHLVHVHVVAVIPRERVRRAARRPRRRSRWRRFVAVAESGWETIFRSLLPLEASVPL